MFFRVFSLVFLSLCAGQQLWVPFNTTEFHESFVSPNGNVALFYKISPDRKTLTVAAAFRSLGWAAVGLSENGGMVGADIALFYQDTNGTNVLENLNSQAYVQPTISTKNRLNLIFGWQYSNYQGQGPVTVFSFSRPVHISNKDESGINPFYQQHIDFELDRSSFFIYAYGEGNEFGYHGPNRGAFVYNDHVPAFPTDLPSLKYKSPNTTIPVGSTQYCFTFISLPHDTDYWIAAERALVSGSNVHHVVLYSCPDNATVVLEEFPPGQTSFCNTSWVGTQCLTFYFGWAVGVTPHVYPKNLGKPFGANAVKNVLLEIHYVNVETEFVDGTTGVELFYTDKKPEHNIATLFVGSKLNQIRLPPGLPSANVTNKCTPEMTRFLIPPTGIHVLSTTLHMHQRGRRQSTLWIKKNRKHHPRYLAKTDHYSFFNQYIQFHKDHPLLLPGDELVTTCYYDTTQDTDVVNGGRSTFAEMCFTFIEYYPEQPIVACIQ